MHVLQNRRKTETGFFYRATHIQLMCIAQHMAWCHRVICPAGRHTQILPRNETAEWTKLVFGTEVTIGLCYKKIWVYLKIRPFPSRIHPEQTLNLADFCTFATVRRPSQVL